MNSTEHTYIQVEGLRGILKEWEDSELNVSKISVLSDDCVSLAMYIQNSKCLVQIPPEY